jgi:hypothetical protein
MDSSRFNSWLGLIGMMVVAGSTILILAFVPRPERGEPFYLVATAAAYVLLGCASWVLLRDIKRQPPLFSVLLWFGLAYLVFGLAYLGQLYDLLFPPAAFAVHFSFASRRDMVRLAIGAGSLVGYCMASVGLFRAMLLQRADKAKPTAADDWRTPSDAPAP